MRRFGLMSSLAVSAFAFAAVPAQAQYSYPPGSYRSVEREPISAADPDDDLPPLPSRPAARPSYGGVESQPLPPPAGSAAPYPYETRPRITEPYDLGGRRDLPPVAQPPAASAQPPVPDRDYAGRPPVYGAMPPYNEPAPYRPSQPNTGYGAPSYPPSSSYPPSGPYGSPPSAAPMDAPPRPPVAIEARPAPYGPGYVPSAAPAGPGYPPSAAPAAPGRNNVYAALPPEDQPEMGAPKQLPPQFQRQVVPYQTKEPAGTIVIDTPSTFLYYVNGDGTAIRYGIGVGREGFTWAGVEKITRMAEWPDWHPPAEMIDRQPYLPRFMAGGESNPLGARALYLGKTIYRIHGTNQPSTIGQFVSSGCIRMLNEDVQDLYSRVKVGTKVVVLGDGKGVPPSNATAKR